MSQDLYDFLADSVLFDEASIETHYSGLTTRRLSQELDRYRRYAYDIKNDLLTHLAPGSPDLGLYFRHGDSRHAFGENSKTVESVL